jgi:hypothetical protein
MRIGRSDAGSARRLLIPFSFGFVNVRSLTPSSAVSSSRVEQVFRFRAVEDFDAFNPGLQHLGVDTQRIAGKDKKVRVFTCFDEPTRLKVEHFGAGQSQLKSAFSLDRPPRTARRRSEKRRNQWSIIRMKPTSAPALSSIFAFSIDRLIVSIFPPGASILIIEHGAPARAIERLSTLQRRVEARHKSEFF